MAAMIKMMAMTMSNSINEKPRRFLCMATSLGDTDNPLL
jgi:hypothetical protein